jgi:hypothetical protein
VQQPVPMYIIKLANLFVVFLYIDLIFIRYPELHEARAGHVQDGLLREGDNLSKYFLASSTQ